MTRANGTDELAQLEDDLRGTPYRPLRAIGRGGMGSVYEVEHRTLRRKLVIKVLREPNRPDLEDRLRLEAQTLAQLSHPNLLAVHDYAHTASRRPFIVSERLFGKTLKEHLGPTGSLPLAEAVMYARQALSGLAEAHRAGVVHRDVKLDNLFLCDATAAAPAHVKVIDFGIAKLVGGEASAAVRVAPLEVPTAEGVMVGTPSFMSPEQVKNLPVDHRADLYGVGVVLYRLVTGRNPFICRDVFEYATAHATDAPPAPSRFVALPLALEAAILRALEKEPSARFADAASMSEALAAALAPRGSPPAPVGARPQTTTVLNEGTAGAPAPALSPSRPHVPASPSSTVMMTPPMSTQRLLPSPSSTLPMLAPPVEAQRRPLASSPSDVRPGRARRRWGWLEIAALLVSTLSVAAILWFALMLLGALR